MVQEIVINVALAFYCLLAIIEKSWNSYSYSYTDIRKKLNGLSPNTALRLFFIPLVLFGLLILRGTRSVFSLYIYTSLGSLLLLHILWLTRRSKRIYRFSLFFASIGLISIRIFFPSQLVHNIFILLVVVWLGPIISSFKFFTKKTFIVISSLWFLYDIYYVWSTSTYKQVISITQQAGFSLSLVIGKTSIGLADLLFASLLLSVIKGRKYKVIATLLLISSNILLTIFVYNIHFVEIFPLLVLWVPCGLAVILVEKYSRDIRF